MSEGLKFARLFYRLNSMNKIAAISGQSLAIATVRDDCAASLSLMPALLLRPPAH